MLRFVLRRCGQALLTLLLLSAIVFFMFRLLPADPTAAMVDAALSPEQIAALKAEFGLDKPLAVQYGLYLKNILLKGDFGTSFFYKQPALKILGDKILNTVILSLAAILIAYTVGSLLGALMAWYRGSLGEAVGIVGGLVFRAAPEFWVGMVFVMIFAYGLGWLPHSGMREAGYVADTLAAKYLSLDFLRHLVLPATVAALHMLSTPMLLLRNAMLEVRKEEFVELAYAKGLPFRRIIFRHAARNALLPVVTSLATAIGRSVGGMVLVEYVFSWPGLGREIVLAATRYDFPVAQAAFLMIAALIMAMNILADVLYGYLDPRIVYK